MKYSLLLSVLLVVFGCHTPRQATVTSPSSSQLVVDGKLWSSIFQQRAAEYKALCIQAFNIARMRVDETIKERASMVGVRSPAIITDIDETFLDNSPNSVHQALLGKDYEPTAWAEWTSKANADTMSGALGFFNYAASKGITIFYITNRDEKDKAGTLANLKRFGFPYADELHMLVRTTSSGKEERRQQVAANYDILLLLGDNLSDFSALFDKKTEAERNQHVYRLADQFGKKFIVLPNFNYGGWEDAIYDNRRDWTPAQKDSLLRSKLKSY